jgi:hypothetical protein
MRFKSLVLAAGVALGLILAVPPTSAFAIGQVTCGDRTDVVKLDVYSNSNQCFADTGVRAVNINNVLTLHSGKNKVTINYEWQGRYYTVTADRARVLTSIITASCGCMRSASGDAVHLRLTGRAWV